MAKSPVNGKDVIDLSIYKHLFESMQDGLAIAQFIFNEKGEVYDYRFLDANPAFEKHTGLTKSVLIGNTASSVFPGADLSLVGQYFAQRKLENE
jgi:PAS domain S-box-containing protein